MVVVANVNTTGICLKGQWAFDGTQVILGQPPAENRCAVSTDDDHSNNDGQNMIIIMAMNDSNNDDNSIITTKDFFGLVW